MGRRDEPGDEPVPRRRTVARIGLFGGTFDPPHAGHTAVAADVADALGLDRVLWIPAGEPPHKDPDQPSPSHLRMEMVREAVRSDSRFEASAIELERPGPSFTVDTVRELHARHPGAPLFVIIGVDQYRALDTWRDPRGILELARLVVMDRDGATPEDVRPRVLEGVDRGPGADGAQPSVVFVPVRRVDLSSSGIRARVGSGESISGLVDPGVEAVVAREGLYAESRRPCA
jgi:nicotinate-nucleotide adenylyltransferase